MELSEETKAEIAALRAEAKRSDEAAEESFQRCDTDGFLSQWALGLGAQRYRKQADLLEAGGVATFIGLYQGDRRVKAKQIEVPAFNAPWATDWQWFLDKSEVDLIAARGKRYLPTGSKSRVLKALGLAERAEWDKAEAQIVGKGKGLSGSAWVEVVRTGDAWGGTAKLEKETV